MRHHTWKTVTRRDAERLLDGLEAMGISYTITYSPSTPGQRQSYEICIAPAYLDDRIREEAESK